MDEGNGTVLVSSQAEQTEGKVKRRNKRPSEFSGVNEGPEGPGEVQERRLGARRVLMSPPKIPVASWAGQGFQGVWLWLCPNSHPADPRQGQLGCHHCHSQAGNAPEQAGICRMEFGICSGPCWGSAIPRAASRDLLQQIPELIQPPNLSPFGKVTH